MLHFGNVLWISDWDFGTLVFGTLGLWDSTLERCDSGMFFGTFGLGLWDCDSGTLGLGAFEFVAYQRDGLPADAPPPRNPN